MEAPGQEVKEFKVEFNEQTLGDLGKENHRLSAYLDAQKDLIERHLGEMKKGALKEYTGILKIDNEKAVNQAMQDYADEMNTLLEGSLADLTEVAQKYGDLLGDKMTSESIAEHYKKVAEEFGPKLEAHILSSLNSKVSSIIKGAEERAKAPPVKYGNPFDINARRANEIK